jgi:hypothetical protein
MRIIKFINSNTIIRSALVFLCLISAWGALLYYFFSLNNFFCILAVILAVISFVIIHLFFKPFNSKNSDRIKTKSTIFDLVFFTVFLALYGLFFYVLYNNRTDSAIISPWEVLPPYLFLLFGVITAIILLLAAKNSRFFKPLVFLYYFLFFAVAVVVYKINYGFDSFIHQATENLISQVGSVAPKPFYYLGQYSLVVILGKIFQITIVYIDKLLVPMLAAIFIPWSLSHFLERLFADKKNIALIITASLLFPVAYFTVSTPQNLAYLFLIIAVLIGFVCASYFDLVFVYVLAVAAFLTHPLAGIPACLLAIILTIFHSDRQKMKQTAYAITYALMAICLPLAFWFINRNNGGLSSASAPLPEKIANFIVPGQENFILNFLYLYGFNLKYILPVFFIGGLIIAIKHEEIRRKALLYFFSGLALIISYFITRFIPFDFLINYERGYYADRILLIAAFFLMPLALIFLYWLVEKIRAENYFVKISSASLLVIILTASFYFSYPRFDNYFNSRGYSTSASDIKAVEWIAANSAADYIVLANQQVSAAALATHGFYKYYPGDIFYYSIPTGDILYQYYLEMVYKNPAAETIRQAMAMAGVSEGYFVLNNYWWGFDKILAEAKLGADSWQEIDNGQVVVFKYIK